METNIINTAQFRIIGRIGSINTLDNVTHLSIASDRRTKDEKGKWTPQANWNSVTVLSAKMRKRLEDPNVSQHGNLVAIEGSIQFSSYMGDGEKVFATSLVAQDLDILQFANTDS